MMKDIKSTDCYGYRVIILELSGDYVCNDPRSEVFCVHYLFSLKLLVELSQIWNEMLSHGLA